LVFLERRISALTQKKVPSWEKSTNRLKVHLNRTHAAAPLGAFDENSIFYPEHI
jgi:hypothetical protein